MERAWGGLHHTATNFFAAVKPASITRLLSLVTLIADRSTSSRTDIVTGMVIDTKSESFAATLDQSCETGEQFHIICRAKGTRGVG